jgi:glycosyltransferase involved in cell wall biosynthesis
MKKYRVLIIVENLPVPFDRRVWLEATTLAKAGYVVSVICPMGKGSEAPYEIIEDVAIYRHSLPLEASGAAGYFVEYGAALFWEFSLALKVAFTRGFDAVHACNPPDLIFLIAAVFKLFGRKFLFDQHDLCPEVFEAKFARRGVQYTILKVLERLTFAIADVVISTNQSYRNVALTRGGKRTEDVFVVRSGPDLERWPAVPPVQPEWRKGRCFMVGYVGVMGEQEGLEFLIEAARILLSQGADIQFVLVGDGSHKKNLVEMVSKLKLDDNFTFTGRVSDKDLLSVLGTADVCVNPDRFNELNDKSTMNKIIEYMAMSKPIVQFDLVEGRFSAGEASLFAKPDDAADMAAKIATLLENPEKRAAMGKLGRARVENELAWNHQAPILLAAYDRLFARSRAA